MRDMVLPTVGEHVLGLIAVDSDTLLVADPCYINSAPHCYVFIGSCRKGEWTARTRVVDAGVWGRRVQLLDVRIDNPAEWVQDVGVAGVDSGQMSVMDDTRKHDWDSSDGGDPFSFQDEENAQGPFSYDGACYATLYTTAGGGVIGSSGTKCALAAVSTSGIGDGAYEVRAGYIESEVVAVQVWFFYDDELAEMRESSLTEKGEE